MQQQIPLTVRLYVDGSVQSGDLRSPSTPDAVIEQLGDEQRSSASVNGRDYTVIERHYAVSPEKSGTLQITSASFRGQAVVPAAEGSDPGDALSPFELHAYFVAFGWAAYTLGDVTFLAQVAGGTSAVSPFGGTLGFRVTL